MNGNIDTAQLAFILDSMAMTNSALANGVIPSKFAARRMQFDIEMGQKLIGATAKVAVDIPADREKEDEQS